MKKRNGSKKVLRAMALGLATMIAVTSVPVTTFAGDGEPESTTTTTTTSVSTTTSEPQSSEPSSDPQPSSGSQQASNLAPATITVIDQTEAKKEVNEAIQTPVVITKDGTVINTGEKLNEKYPVTNPSEAAVAGLDAYGNKKNLDKNEQGQYINNVPGYIDESMDLTKEALENVSKFGQSDVKITGLKNDANNELAGADAQIIAVLEPVFENGNPVYEQETDENGNPVFDGAGNPVYVMEDVLEQDTNPDGSLKYDENGAPVYKVKTDEQGNPVKAPKQKTKLVYKDVADIKTKTAVGDTETGLSDARSDIKTANTSSNENEARAAAAKIKSDLETAEQGLKDMGKILSDAADRYDETQTKYNAAQKKLYEAEQELATQKEYLKNAIKDSAAAHAALEATEKKVAEIKAEVEGLYAENDAAELELISKLYDAFKKNDNGKNVWVNAGNLCKALIKYYITHDESNAYVDGFAISGGIDGVDEEDYADLSKELLSYSRKVIDTYEEEETTDADGNPMKVYTPKDATEYDFPGSEYDGKTYEWKTIGEEKTGWVSAKGYDENNVVVVRYKYKDGEEIKEAERYFNVKIDPDTHEFYFYERTIDVVTDTEKSIAAKDGQYGYNDYFDEDNTDHKTGGLSTLYNEKNGNANKVVDVITDENGNVTQKAVPASDTPRKDSVKNTPPQNDGNKITYEKAKDENGNYKESQKEYSWGQTEAISTSYEGTIKHTDKTDNTKAKTWDLKSLEKLNQQLSDKLTKLSEDYPADQGYRVEVEYVVKGSVFGKEVVLYSDSKEASTYSDVEGWASGFLNGAAAFFGMASYDIKVVHKSNMEDGIIETETQEYVKTTNDSKPGSDKGYGSSNSASSAGVTARDADLLNLGVTYEEGKTEYVVDLKDSTGKVIGKRTVKIEKDVTTDDYTTGALWWKETKYKYDYKISYKDETNEKVVIATKGYDGKLYNYAQRDEIVGNNGLTLQKIVWSADLKYKDPGTEDAGLVKSYISYRDAMKELQEAYDKVKAAEEKSKKLEEKIAALEQQTVDRSELNRLQRELANAKSALDRANADLENKQSEYNELLEAEIDLSRFDHHEGHQAPDEDPVAEETYFGPVIPTSPVPGGIAPASDPSGVAGARIGRRSGSRGQERGVAGVRVDDGNEVKNNKPVVINEIDNSGKDQSVKNLQKVETPETPLAATPFKEDPVNPAIVGISIAALLAVLAGLYYEYNRRKKAKAEEMNKYKKN